MIELDLQVATEHEVPDATEFQRWVETALSDGKDHELTIRLVDEAESESLNSQFRGKSCPTNVLSFPADLPAGLDVPLLGDIVICAPLVAREAGEQGKPVDHHWAHLTVHGVLHLLGMDHQQEEEAFEMESLEARLLDALGIADPYA